MEGALRRVVSSTYERNPAARDACIAHFGCLCAVCAFSFEAVYGPTGAGFIHVHPLAPLASKGLKHVVDPITDLIPICPNCHAMLHKDNPPLTIQELKQLISLPTRG